jgi:hypothetical protein
VPPQAAEDFYRAQQRLQLVLVAAGRKAWSRMLADFDASWASIAPSLLGVASAAQLAAARTASAYVPAVLDEIGQPDLPDARVRPQAFAGVAADGRSLDGLLRGSVVRTKLALGNGTGQAEALARGGRHLDMLLQGVVTDAARGVTQAEVAVRDNVGFVRMVNPPCCGRCAILAGKWYRYNAGFPRHPRCDCTAIPATENVAGDLLTSPQALFSAGHVQGLTKREADRLANGDDLVSVVNESRDMWRARLSEQRIAEKSNAKTARMGLEDLFASTRSRTEALDAMKAQGYVA